VVFLVVAPVCALLVRRRPYRTAPLRAALWSLVLLRLVLPPDLALPWSAGDCFGDLLGDLLGLSAPVLEEGSGELQPPRGTALSPAGAAASSSTADPLRWNLWLSLLCWGLGASMVAGVFLRRRRRFVDLVRSGQRMREGPVTEMAARWRRRFRIRRTVRLVTADAAVSPFTFGTWRPVIFLPAALLETPRLAEAAVAHETAHVARWDDLRLLLQRGVQALWFFHPVAWLAGARLHEEHERLCDLRVLACGELSPQDYGRSLLTVARLNLEGGAPSPAFGTSKGRIAMRIREIVTEGHRRPRTLPALLAVTVLGLFLLPLAPTRGAVLGSDVGVSAPATGTAWGFGTAGHGVAHSAAHGIGRGDGHGEGYGKGHDAGHDATHADRHPGASWGEPVPAGRVTSPFGERINPLTGERGRHDGVDLGASTGTPILAPAAGRVTVATNRYEGGEHHGTVVVLDHSGGLQSFYSHLDSLSVSPGQEVARGQQLGTVGSTGEVTGPHLHFEVWRDGEPVDPAGLVPSLRRR
jgi:beta-lactamase regulating signal transducer with metallopeptidase domain